MSSLPAAAQDLQALSKCIVRLCSPQKILVFSEKHRPDGTLLSVKLCVIIADGDAAGVEHALYVGIDCDLPFDVLVYTKEDWRRLQSSPVSFASQIARTGRVLYETD